MSKESYADSRWGVQQEYSCSGSDRTTLLITPQAGTGAETKTHTTTLKHEAFSRPVKIKKIIYLVDTAYTGAGCSTVIDVYKNTTSSGSLSVTSEAALAIATSSDLDITLAATDYIRLYVKGLSTASTANGAIGIAKLLYEEVFTNA